VDPKKSEKITPNNSSLFNRLKNTEEKDQEVLKAAFINS
jgi:hypothetical protein